MGVITMAFRPSEPKIVYLGCVLIKSIAEGGLINVRFGALSGHKSDIVICPLCAIGGRL
jgi:hypothetical protein